MIDTEWNLALAQANRLREGKVPFGIDHWQRSSD